jgi:formamidopyrimidine-DNA glycosylase
VPEGDTVHLAARRLDSAFGDEVLTRTDFRVPQLATTDLSGRPIVNVIARGKHLLFRIGEGISLHTHFKMEGSWHIYHHGQRWRGPGFQVRAVLENKDRVAVGFRLAVVELIETSQEDRVVAHLGPDPLGPDWDADEALRRLSLDQSRPVEDALLDQRVMAGPGNVYKCEVCFLRGVHPGTPVGEVEDLSGMVRLVKSLMEANRETGSQITTGDSRRGREHWVYGRANRPCRRCGTGIAKRPQSNGGADRVTYWCPHCQPE